MAFTPAPVLDGAQPYRADPAGADAAVVISHGFTGTPQSVRPWGEALAAAGVAVRVPRLPGHGTRWQDLNQTRWQDWYAELERAYLDAAARYPRVLVAGLSMGGTLATRVAELHPVAAVVLVNPFFATARRDARLARYVAWAVPSRPGIGSDVKKPGVAEQAYPRTPLAAFVQLQKLAALTVADLPLLTAPVYLLRSRVDHVVEPVSAEALRRGATATTVHETVLEDSYHVATLDHDAELITRETLRLARPDASGDADGAR